MKVCNKYKTLLITDMTIKQFDRWLKWQSFKSWLKNKLASIR